MWHSPEMKAVWDHVGDEIKDGGGKLLQPTGVWQRDYGVLLAELVKEDRDLNDVRRDGGADRTEAQSVVANWRAHVETFLQKGVSGVRVVPDEHEPLITIALVKAGLLFQARAINGPDDSVGDSGSVPGWQVSNVPLAAKPETKLEAAVRDCLNARPTRWDLAYLLVSLRRQLPHHQHGLRSIAWFNCPEC